MARFLPLIGTLIVGIVAAFEPNAQAWVANNPAVAATVAMVLAAILNLLKSPIQK